MSRLASASAFVGGALAASLAAVAMKSPSPRATPQEAACVPTNHRLLWHDGRYFLRGIHATGPSVTLRTGATSDIMAEDPDGKEVRVILRRDPAGGLIANGAPAEYAYDCADGGA
jgi:hypothetical protein